MSPKNQNQNEWNYSFSSYVNNGSIDDKEFTCQWNNMLLVRLRKL